MSADATQFCYTYIYLPNNWLLMNSVRSGEQRMFLLMFLHPICRLLPS